MIFKLSALEDQVFAGALMWVFGTFVYMAPAVIRTVRSLSCETALRAHEPAIHVGRHAGRAYEHSPAEVA
jgi:hypothetical protein